MDGTARSPDPELDRRWPRLAAVGDLHAGDHDRDRLLRCLGDVAGEADVLVVAGDLTRHGTTGEAEAVAGALAELGLPVFAVLGNHDHEADADALMDVLCSAGIVVLEGSATVITVRRVTLAIAGAKGFAGGFPGAQGCEFGEPLMKSFSAEARLSAAALEQALLNVEASVRVAVSHYSPARSTLKGEHPELFPFLGSAYLGEAVERGGADLAVHGHAHLGCEQGTTPNGVPVRNVAQPVLERPYAVYPVSPHIRSDTRSVE